MIDKKELTKYLMLRTEYLIHLKEKREGNYDDLQGAINEINAIRVALRLGDFDAK